MKKRQVRKLVHSGPENIRVVQKIGSGRIKGDVGCDQMVFAINCN